jgi:hypothetical protein
VGHLNELWAKYRDRGLVVLAVTDEGRSLVDKFVETTSSSHPIIIEDGDSAGDYGISGFPSSFLIDAAGRIAWAGHPGNLQEADIEKLLADVVAPPVLPRKLDSARKAIDKGDFAGARKALEGALAGTGLEEADRKSAEEGVKWIDSRGEALLKSAADDDSRGDPVGAAATYRKCAASFKGLEAGTKADGALEALLKDKDKKREIDAADAWEKLREKLKPLKPEQAAATCKAFAKKWEGTKAATKASDAEAKYSKPARR